MNKNWIMRILIGIIVIFAISISGISKFITDYLWFDALGFDQIFLISLFSKIKLFAITAIIFFIFVVINIWISSMISEKRNIPFKFKLLITTALSIIIGVRFSSEWFKLLQYFNQTSFNIMDPIFAKDVSFYIFTLPFYQFVLGFLMSTIIITIILVILDYLSSLPDFKKSFTKQEVPEGVIPVQPKLFDFKMLLTKRKIIIHSGILISIFFLLLAVKHYLSRFSIMYSKKGIVVGAGYSDVVAYLPMIKILMVLAVIIAILLLVWVFIISKQAKLRKRHIFVYALIIYFIFGFLGPTVIPGIVQALKVSPNEINLEKPYIENNIKFTRMAYGLSDVEERVFDVEMGLTSEVLDEAKETIDNVRILDWRPLTKTYKQTQEIRLYYDLAGIDIDRYNIDGKYTQVMLAPRELDQNQITQNAKTWVNLHMVYTHGYGVVMSPVNEITKQGLPNYLIKDIPPVYTVEEKDLKISKPQIYYGEKDNNFVLVNTKTNEFDYPKGNTNEYINYDGKGGIELNSFLRKVLMAIRFGDIKILLSSDISKDSKIMFTRHITERISKLTPFIKLDADPYLVIDNEKLLWIIDAYTFSGNYPYSEKYMGINYVRNSVKIVVDAYDGSVTYYIMDENDPIIETYAKIFPQQFKQFEDMPDSVKKHIRYPVDLFKIQSHIYSTYHMDDVKVFYNKEDAWEIPNEVYGVGQKVKVEPYYIIIKLPNEEKEEFVLMSSFTPIKKDNMVAWMAARSDNGNYGKLILYKFQKDKLIYGPLQIEAKIDQDSEISKQLTLWSQQGSRVTRGNLLVIPINNSILYIEPLYIQAETGQLPELKRILVSDGESVVMEENLALSLEALFGKSKRVIKKDDSIQSNKKMDSDLSSEPTDTLVGQAQAYYDLIEESMKEGDWNGIGDNLDKLGNVLEGLSEK
ncbi:UPF0182 family protein [Candidatus Woesearchaeota archaeon]|nr:UPF0182 family protein [Candidatus Woesearchaeota archaeon]